MQADFERLLERGREAHDIPDDLDVACRVGGETVAEDSTRYYNYKVAEVVSFISQFLTLWLVREGLAQGMTTAEATIKATTFYIVIQAFALPCPAPAAGREGGSSVGSSRG